FIYLFDLYAAPSPKRTRAATNSSSTPLISLSKCYCFPGSFKDRAEILHSSIHLKNATRKDSGKYRCEISAPTEQGQGTGEVEISLLILVPPSAPVCEVPISALSGTVVEMRCKESEGVPASKYRWYRNGASLPENTFFWRFKKEKISYTLNTTTGTLLFNPVSKNDTGEYYCEAYNRVGRPQRCPVKRMQVGTILTSVPFSFCKDQSYFKSETWEKNSKDVPKTGSLVLSRM
uniref:Junctional adhesion molecule 2 n=1 Tax=Naja naja TaxID=35670 RepID=A0A8C6XZF6_NAJNA